MSAPASHAEPPFANWATAPAVARAANPASIGKKYTLPRGATGIPTKAAHVRLPGALMREVGSVMITPSPSPPCPPGRRTPHMSGRVLRGRHGWGRVACTSKSPASKKIMTTSRLRMLKSRENLKNRAIASKNEKINHVVGLGN